MTDYAQLAQSLKDNEAFQRALDLTRQGAVDALISAKPDDEHGIIRYQATIGVVDDIRENLEQFIRSGAVRSPPGIA